jgi:hypothetical protein
VLDGLRFVLPLRLRVALLIHACGGVCDAAGSLGSASSERKVAALRALRFHSFLVPSPSFLA